MATQASLDLLIDQWSDKPNLRYIIQTWLDVHREQIEEAFSRLKLMADIDEAEGVWLDFIGIRLGVSRPSVDSTTDFTEEEIRAFGFSSLDGTSKSGLGFGQAPFDYTKGSVTTITLDNRVQLGDASYRRLVKARGWYVRAEGTLFFLRKAILEIDSEASVVDDRDMTVTISTKQISLMRIAIDEECLPIPPSIGVDLIGVGTSAVPAGVTISKSAITLFEGRSTTYTVVLDSPPATGETVTITPESSDANHVTVSGGPLEFDSNNWRLPQPITVEAIVDSDSDDESETITNRLSTDGTRYSGISPADITVTVVDETVAAATPVISIGFYLNATSIVEGNSAEWEITSDIEPTADLVIGLTISQSGSFVAATDIGADKEVTLEAGETSVRYSVDTIDDENVEAAGSVTATLNSGTGYAINTSANSGEVTITDNDTAVVFEISVAVISASVQEGGNARFRISSNNAVTSNLEISYTVTQMGDFTAGGVLGAKTAIISDTFRSVDIAIPTINDNNVEDAGAIIVTVNAPTDSSYTVSSANGSASVAVTSEDVVSATRLPVPVGLTNSRLAIAVGTTLYISPAWTAVPGADSYTVRVGVSDAIFTEPTGKDPTIALIATDSPNLNLHDISVVSGKFYWFSVRANSSNPQVVQSSLWSGWQFMRET